jgi:hypothetical protein
VLLTSTYNGRADGDAPTPDPALDTPFFYMANDVPGRPNTTYSPTDPIPTIDLSTFAALQNIAASSTLKFRMYAWGATSETATFGFRITGPKITGIVSSTAAFGAGGAVPEPGTTLLAGTVIALGGLIRRRK